MGEFPATSSNAIIKKPETVCEIFITFLKST